MYCIGSSSRTINSIAGSWFLSETLQYPWPFDNYISVSLYCKVSNQWDGSDFCFPTSFYRGKGTVLADYSVNKPFCCIKLVQILCGCKKQHMVRSNTWKYGLRLTFTYTACWAGAVLYYISLEAYCRWTLILGCKAKPFWHLFLPEYTNYWCVSILPASEW